MFSILHIMLFLSFLMEMKSCLWWYIFAISAVPKPHDVTGLESSFVIMWGPLAMVVLDGPWQGLPEGRGSINKCSMNVEKPP
jgi:hypothetical protein